MSYTVANHEEGSQGASFVANHEEGLQGARLPSTLLITVVGSSVPVTKPPIKPRFSDKSSCRRLSQAFPSDASSLCTTERHISVTVIHYSAQGAG
jgi:hypothetical protein